MGDDRWAGTLWRITGVGDQEIAGEASIGFDAEGRVYGRSVVNRFFGAYTWDGEVLSCGPLGSTMMAGPPQAMAEEQLVLRALDGPMTVVEQADGSLLLVGATQVRLVAPEPADPTTI